eukprot:3215388-Pyramimonas_sp.AAC.3
MGYILCGQMCHGSLIKHILPCTTPAHFDFLRLATWILKKTRGQAKRQDSPTSSAPIAVRVERAVFLVRAMARIIPPAFGARLLQRASSSNPLLALQGRPNMIQDILRIAPMRPQDCSKATPRGHGKSFTTSRIFKRRLHPRLVASDGRLQDRPRQPREPPGKAPRRPQERTRAPKSAPT